MQCAYIIHIYTPQNSNIHWPNIRWVKINNNNYNVLKCTSPCWHSNESATLWLKHLCSSKRHMTSKWQVMLLRTEELRRWLSHQSSVLLCEEAIIQMNWRELASFFLPILSLFHKKTPHHGIHCLRSRHQLSFSAQYTAILTLNFPASGTVKINFFSL